MNRNQADKIIKEYKSHKGFYDLSEKPKELSKREYAIILDTQNLLAKHNENIEEIIENQPMMWNELQQLSSMLQSVILRYWEVG